MNRPVLFDSPFLLGFEHTRSLVERAAKAAAESYPPYNVEDRGDGGIRITLAVAGFSPEQLEVTMEDRQLTIAGRRDDVATRPGDTGRGEAFLHRGIAARGFIRAFVLADGMVVEEASLEHGLLHIDLSRPEPEKRVIRVPIRTKG
ncbi:MAG TPA: Hsp20 family protein [Phenylobacterium sp.]|jgi:HSP20 family molecular chaperone IbpA|uniref:Hsp20 family protein n=1 Tax=Phenylobacterium sp. TaxID=1871053 RepID=UPI002CD63C71|nr:Hsp20 family protein [Phenylobacterium sp.]HXA39988.1 Hsp20 family protein [Phenylobacterium sp.]